MRGVGAPSSAERLSEAVIRALGSSRYLILHVDHRAHLDLQVISLPSKRAPFTLKRVQEIREHFGAGRCLNELMCQPSSTPNCLRKHKGL